MDSALLKPLVLLKGHARRQVRTSTIRSEISPHDLPAIRAMVYGQDGSCCA